MSKPAPTSAQQYLPVAHSLSAAREAIHHCRGCPLYRDATQPVFGEGPKSAKVLIVGEQPGDKEDQAGRPFIGPAGKLLDKALAEVGIPREEAYVTNAVKHFKFTRRGKKRLHQKPTARQVHACKPWLTLELEIIKPRLLIALGATAAYSLFGPAFRVMRQRGQPVESPWAAWAMATVHPSSLLRAPDDASRREAWQAFIADLRQAADQYRRLGS